MFLYIHIHPQRVLAEAQGHVEAAVPKKRATGSDSDDDDDDDQKDVAAAGCDTAAEEQAKARAKRAKKVIKALGAREGE